ncbi:hypothetical protein RclHR1_02720021 [Rhizophagus clarus]|uniref:Crinkler effector protein N-terminal domain-containing protein n=1 Tax=Rhizophagus clarus TaxID=94130 RepID=A0A2Z6RWC1_9GLOM|nr:hypothetical protein RclHR1_02720021 [Rhizophagus clarus]
MAPPKSHCPTWARQRENPYDNSFPVDIDTNKVKTVGHQENYQGNDFANVDAYKLKLWKVNISFEEPNEKLDLVDTKINVNIKEDLGGEELPPLSKTSKHFPSQPADEHIHIIVQRPVEAKEPQPQQPFSSYTFPKMKVLFGLKADSYDQLPCIEIGSSATPEQIRNSVIEDF